MKIMTTEGFNRLIQNHIWHVYTDGKIGKNWELPKNYPHKQLPGFSALQAFVFGMIIGQLEYRKNADDFVTIYTQTKRIEKISHIILNAIAQIQWDHSKPWIPNEETKQAMREARAGIFLKEYSIVDELFEDLHDDK